MDSHPKRRISEQGTTISTVGSFETYNIDNGVVAFSERAEGKTYSLTDETRLHEHDSTSDECLTTPDSDDGELESGIILTSEIPHPKENTHSSEQIRTGVSRPTSGKHKSHGSNGKKSPIQHSETYHGHLSRKISRKEVWNERKISSKDSEPLDFWQVGAVVGGFFANVICGGLGAMYGVLYTYMQEPLEASELELSWTGSLMTGFQGLAAIITTLSIDKCGCRRTTMMGPLVAAVGLITASQSSNLVVLYVTLGVLPGVGACLIYNATMVHVSEQFTKWRPLAVGFSVSGAAVGMLALPPLTALLADVMGWRGTLLIQAGIILNMMPCALWIKPRSDIEPSTENVPVLHHRVIEYLKVYRDRRVVCMSLSFILIGLSYHAFTVFLPPLVMVLANPLTAPEAALVISLVGFGGLVGRVGSSVLALVHKKAPEVIFVCGVCFCGVFHFTVSVLTEKLAFMINGVCYGLALGAWPAVASVVYVNIFGLKNLSKTLGSISFCQGIGAFAGPPVFSYISMATENQDVAFYAAGSSYIICAVCVLPLVTGRKHNSVTDITLNIETTGKDNVSI